ncbi:MAG: right-handed parallel beta-helix repeat-containing protein [Pyrinomonadaceae bacterium]|nr:right-handed parallel beta-helix repeat-containing protein [Phycisphaerales bacterium]
MNRCSFVCVIVLVSCLLAATGCLVYSTFAGPLDPPAGPVSPTYKTLAEVEPRMAVNATNTPGDAGTVYRITQPGSYYLTSNISGVALKHGVQISSSGVTLNLNGFDLMGVAGSLDGVSAGMNDLTNIAVVNGSIRNWGGRGIDLGTMSANNCRVAEVLASGNIGYGIGTGAGSTITSCSAYNNSGGGINVLSVCSITNCSVYDNAANGISAGQVCTVSNCTAFTNTGVGVDTSSGCTITNCAAFFNTGTGINTGSGSTISNCSSFQNTGSGISVMTGSAVTDCAARFNSADGIVCVAQCFIQGNTCSTNGAANGAGIHATGSDNRIEGNACAAADRGIDVDGSGNVIIRNTCTGNSTNWAIAANNVCGPIVDRTTPGSAAINGNSAPDSTGTTHPHANFTY